MNSSENVPLLAAPDEAVALGDPPQQRKHEPDRELAVARVRTSGVFATTRPRLDASSRSTLFTPTA